MRAGLAGCLAVLVAISGACGGRLARESDDGFGADTGTGGSSSSIAGTNRGATSSTGARPSTGGGAAFGGKSTGIGGKATGVGASPAGGTFGASGSTAAGGGCACPDIACAPGYKMVPNVNGCCFHCESLCDQVPCAGIACGSGSHLEQLPGQCCPTCVQDSCVTQRTNYQVFRQQLIDKYSTLSCMTNGDCTIYYEKNQCAVGCGIPLPAAAINLLDSNLQSYAQQNCSPNCMTPIPPCEPTPAPTCFKGWCG
jgi:hypothetical protein